MQITFGCLVNVHLKCCALCLLTGSGLNDGQWHSVELSSGPDHLSITLDKDEGATAHTSILLPLTTDTQLFFGGEWTCCVHVACSCVKVLSWFKWRRGVFSPPKINTRPMCASEWSISDHNYYPQIFLGGLLSSAGE